MTHPELSKMDFKQIIKITSHLSLQLMKVGYIRRYYFLLPTAIVN